MRLENYMSFNLIIQLFFLIIIFVWIFGVYKFGSFTIIIIAFDVIITISYLCYLLYQGAKVNE